MSNREGLFRRAVLVLLLSLVLACGSDDDDDGGNGGTGPDDEKGHPPAAMVDSWLFQSATLNGTSVSLSDVLEWVPDAVEAHLMVMENGAYVYEEVDVRGGQLWFESGWVFVDPKGGLIEVHTQFDGDGSVNETSELTYTLQSSVLTLREEDEGVVVVFTLVPRK